MALELSFTSQTLGYTFPAAYAKITEVAAHSSQSRIAVAYYANIQARVEGRSQVFQSTFPVDTTQLHGEIYAKAYEYLKTLPEFAGSVDVLGPLPAYNNLAFLQENGLALEPAPAVVEEEPVPEPTQAPAEA